MKSEQLAQYVDGQMNRLRGRIMGVGREQYEDGEEQLFETMSLPELFQFTYEELDDVIVYACMLRIRLKRVEERLP